ncbi:MAG: energy transducer TonB [Alphaproteobacteria bacterium]|nr:energy transducer TonB [Alphaproteobacteria bacterium]
MAAHSVTHAISADYSGFDRMSPTAAALAVLLHVLTALALWWVSPLNRHRDIEQEPIEVTIEQPKAEQPPPPPPQPKPPVEQPQQQVKPPPPPPKVTGPSAPASPLGLPPAPPKSEEKADTPKAEPPKGESPGEPKPPQKIEQQQAVAPPPPPEPKPEPKPEPPLEKVLPPVETPPPPVTSREVPAPPKPAPPSPTPPKPVPKPEVHPPEARPAPPPQQVRPSPLPPSPLQSAPAKRAPQSNDDSVSTTFVNPANNYGVVQAKQTYQDQVARRLSTERFVPRESVAYTGLKGVIGVNMVIGHDGRLLSISIARSSGAPTFDAEMLEFLRRLSPYPPLPSDLGSQYSFMLPIPFNLNPGVQ